MKECNICGNYLCHTITSAFPRWRTKHILTTNEMQSACEYYIPLEPFKVKLLELCLRDFPKLDKVLRGLEMRIVPNGNTIQVVDA